ncbi:MULTISPECIES: hypothetical protein [unclassified Coleofasciculus]|uniref:hypothetical protein n=1 Tax=unclassified Coleofasciculus TaxID=2692782 RepID=UPI00187EA0C0|nr:MULTISPECIES: hypothetical protein [unclassified Coleofasciculus]MBE9124865.1 hypothetical protein [Coleofasciculus sp. LEGE 07081]MBE9147891.1 hypothetical protein [Coleofasciculus sp. LEGE 07092]
MQLYNSPLDKNIFSSQTEALRDRLLGWDSPTQEQLQDIAMVEWLWGRLLDSLLEVCPANREQEQAILHLESVREWTRKSIIRGS